VKLLDRYIIKQFLLSALFSLIAVLVIFIVIDAMEKLDDFIDRQAGLPIIAQYYLFFVPEIIKLVIPIAVLLSSLFITARMSTQNELTAMKSGGISLFRLMVPYLAVSLLITAASVYFNGWVVPYANKKKFAIERAYIDRNPGGPAQANIYFQDSPTRILSIGYFDESRGAALRVSIQDFSDTNLTVLTERVDASSMTWDPSAKRWILERGIRRWFKDGKERLEEFATQSAGPMHFDAEDLRKKQEKPDEMDYFSLQQFIENQQRAGQDVARWQIAFYSKISFPFATVIVVLFGVPFSSVRRRGGVGVQLGISLLICFIYLIFTKVSQVFGYNGDINPLLTAWLANIVFLVGAVYIMSRVPK
jgi:lipopolysaccharide export system permease protein